MMKFQTGHAQIHFCNENWFHCFVTHLTFVFSSQIVPERNTFHWCIRSWLYWSTLNNFQHFTIFDVHLFKITKYFSPPFPGLFLSFPTSDCLICHIFLDARGPTEQSYDYSTPSFSLTLLFVCKCPGPTLSKVPRKILGRFHILGKY